MTYLLFSTFNYPARLIKIVCKITQTTNEITPLKMVFLRINKVSLKEKASKIKNHKWWLNSRIEKVEINHRLPMSKIEGLLSVS